MNKITLLYGTETGNAKKLAIDFVAKAKKTGVQAKLANLDQYRLSDITKEEYLFTIISTHGEGEPPAAAKKFYDHIHQNGFQLTNLKYGVLALGDTAYPLFCKAGEDVDAQLHKLGGCRIVSLQKCDIDYEEDAANWFAHVLQNLSTSGPLVEVGTVVVPKKTSTRKVYTGTVLTNINLNDKDSGKETYHIEISSEGVCYEPGDCIGIKLPSLSPRLYSISSSLSAYSDEVHLTVARNKFYVDDEVRYGVCSDFLSKLKKNDQLEFYVSKNNLFRLPAPDKDIIMIGPGTGIAPFRAFLAERDSTGATGRNWLFFGDQHFETDFLYQTEIQNWIETDMLTRVNVAFSRDQEEKIYVQHKMLQHAGDLFEWLQSGAYLYVCGTKDPMSIDVEAALVKIIEKKGKNASEYIDRLKEEGRYLRDVY
jgi:sulfite reductase (NADPH) flavoprotein alpha-component